MGETSSSSHSRQDPSLLGYGFQGAIANSTPPANFFDQEGGTYFGELEEAFMHQVASLRRTQQAATVSAPHHGDTKPFPTAAGATAATATARPPPTLDIFPAWPMRSRLHTPKECSNVTADSTDDSESSSKNHSNHSSDQQLGAAAAANMASQFDQQASQQQLQHKNMATSSTPRTGKTLDPKVIRRLAQNREAARKSRLRKKVMSGHQLDAN